MIFILGFILGIMSTLGLFCWLDESHLRDDIKKDIDHDALKSFRRWRKWKLNSESSAKTTWANGSCLNPTTTIHPKSFVTSVLSAWCCGSKKCGCRETWILDCTNNLWSYPKTYFWRWKISDVLGWGNARMVWYEVLSRPRSFAWLARDNACWNQTLVSN